MSRLVAAHPVLEDAEAEQYLLGGLQNRPEALAEVDDLAPADFSDENNALIFREMRHLRQQGPSQT